MELLTIETKEELKGIIREVLSEKGSKFYSPKEAAKVLGCSYKTFLTKFNRLLDTDPEFNPGRVGSKGYRLNEDELEYFLKAE